MIILVGTLDPVSLLTTVTVTRGIFNINWTASYFIDVPSTDPDITYCVGITNTVALSSALTYSRCNINKTSH